MNNGVGMWLRRLSGLAGNRKVASSIHRLLLAEGRGVLEQDVGDGGV